MTFVGNGDNNKNDVVAVPELTTLRVSDKDEFYVNLVQYEEEEDSMEEDRCLSEPSTPRIRCHFFCKWIKFFFIFVFVAGLAFVVFKWIAPFLMDKVFIFLILIFPDFLVNCI